jgi:hypothetical protein
MIEFALRALSERYHAIWDKCVIDRRLTTRKNTMGARAG